MDSTRAVPPLIFSMTPRMGMLRSVLAEIVRRVDGGRRRFRDILAEDIFRIHDVEGNVKFGGHPARLGHRIGRAAAVGIRFARLAPQPQHHARHVIARLLEQRRGNGGIDPPRHGNYDFGHNNRR